MPTASSLTIVAARPRASLALGGLALLATGVVGADDAYPLTDRPYDFSLYLSRAETDFDYAGQAVPTRISRIGIHWRERYAPFWIGLMGGYSYVTQTQHAPTAGLELGGYHAGVSVETELYQTPTLGLSFDAGWLYERVDEHSNGDEIELAWRIPWARLLATWHVAPRVDVYGGIRYDAIDGEERLHGATRSTRDIERDADTAGIFGLELRLDENGYVRLEGYDSATRSVTLSFGRRY